MITSQVKGVRGGRKREREKVDFNGYKSKGVTEREREREREISRAKERAEEVCTIKEFICKFRVAVSLGNCAICQTK